MDTIQGMANQVLVNLAIAVITLLGGYAVLFIQKAIAKVNAQMIQIKDDAARKLLTNALDDLNSLVTVTVGAIEQTTASALRQSIKDGAVDKNELLALGKLAFDNIKSKISAETKCLITENLGNFDEYLTDLIENKVREIKIKTAS